MGSSTLFESAIPAKAGTTPGGPRARAHYSLSLLHINWGLTDLPPGARADNRGWRLDYIFADKEFYQSDVIDVSPPTTDRQQ